MPKSKVIVTLGLIIALLPILGFPRMWESFFQVATGLAIIAVSVWINIDKKISLKAKAQRRALHKRQMTQAQEGSKAESNPDQIIQGGSL